jgi:hypothetical protein
MADVATLGIRVQSTGAEQASQRLRDLQKSAAGAETAALDLERQALRTQSSLARAFAGGAAAGLFTAAVAGLKAMKAELLEIDRVARMTNLSLNQVNSLGVLGRMGGLTAEQTNKGLTGLAEKLNEARREENELTKLLEANNQKYKDREGNVIGVNAALDIAAGLIAGAATNLDRIDIAKKLGLTAEWVPLLENGARAFAQARAEAEMLAGTIDQGLVNGAKQFDQAWSSAFTSFGVAAKGEIAAIAAALAGLASQASGFLDGLNRRFQGLFPQTYGQAPAGVQEIPITPSSRPPGMSDATWRTLQSWLQNRRDTSRDFSPWERLRQSGGGGFRSTVVPGSGGGGGGGDSDAESSVDRALRQLREQSDIQKTILETMGMDTATRETMLARQRALNVAARDGEELTEEQRRKIDEAAEAYGRMVAAVEKAKQAQRQLKELSDFAKGTFTGLFTDIGQGLAQGKNLWESFAQAGINALNKIAQKLIEMAAQQLWMSAFGNSGFGSILGGFFGMGGGTGTAIPYAKGGVFANDNVVPFAKGGAFTNSIVSRPTVFPFAKGVGLMGEAGPEAIMPLRRTADGRLGVAGMGGGGTTFAPVTNITVQGNADQNTVAVLKTELDRRDERMRQELPRLVTGARRDRTLKSA